MRALSILILIFVFAACSSVDEACFVQEGNGIVTSLGEPVMTLESGEQLVDWAQGNSTMLAITKVDDQYFHYQFSTVDGVFALTYKGEYAPAIEVVRTNDDYYHVHMADGTVQEFSVGSGRHQDIDCD